MENNVESQASRLLEAARDATSGRAAHLIFGGPGSHMTQTVIALRGGAALGAHENPGEATLLVLDGHVRLVAGESDWEAKRGDLLPVPDQTHSLEAVGDSAVLLTAFKRGSS